MKQCSISYDIIFVEHCSISYKVIFVDFGNSSKHSTHSCGTKMLKIRNHLGLLNGLKCCEIKITLLSLLVNDLSD